MSTHPRLKLFAVALFVTMLACQALTPASKPTAADIEREEQAVYSFFVHAGAGPAVLLQETATNISQDDPGQTIQYVRDGLKNISRETLDNYLERNNNPGELSPDMDLGVEYVLLNAEERRRIFSQPEGWRVFNETYPGSGGYTELSRVGFNDTFDQALIYVGQMAGDLMGAGFYYLLEKKGGEWLLMEQIMVWIS